MKRNKMPFWKDQSGLTLVEVSMVSLILLFIVLGVLRTDLAARYTMRSARVELEAANVLRSFVELEKSKSYVNIADSVTNGVIISDQGTADAADDITGTVTINVTDNGNDTKTIAAIADWNQRSVGNAVARSISLQTLVSEP